jgi:hypothetical protein
VELYYHAENNLGLRELFTDGYLWLQ